MTPLNEECILVHSPGRYLQQVMSRRGMLVRKRVEPICSSQFVIVIDLTFLGKKGK